MFLIALGVNIEVRAGVLMLAIDGLVLAISKTFKIEFGKVKVASDCTQVAIAVIASLLLTSMKSKLRPDEEHRQNSPWNIAADFDIDMSFSKEDIAGCSVSMRTTIIPVWILKDYPDYYMSTLPVILSWFQESVS